MRNRLIAVAILLGCRLALPSSAVATEPHVVEELTFKVDPDDHDLFLRNDAAIWTATLNEQPGFLGKETWLASDPRDEIKLVIRWQTRRDWNAVPKDLLAEADKRFRSAMGDAGWEMLRGRAFRTVEPPKADEGLSVDTLLSRERLMTASVVEIANDPVYSRTKRYLAVPLHDAVANLTGEEEGDVVFECTDDYASRMSLADFLAGDPWLAFRDLDAAEGESWVRKPNAPSPEKMGRAYVVWRNAEKPGDLTWPYAVERIRATK